MLQTKQTRSIHHKSPFMKRFQSFVKANKRSVAAKKQTSKPDIKDSRSRRTQKHDDVQKTVRNHAVTDVTNHEHEPHGVDETQIEMSRVEDTASKRLKHYAKDDRMRTRKRLSRKPHSSHHNTSSSEVENKFPLEEQLYFHGVLPRHEVSSLLKNEGDFLIREAGASLLDTHIMLSVFYQGRIRHLELLPDEDGFFQIDNHRRFSSVPDLIDFYVHENTPITSKVPAVLGKAIGKQEWELKNDDVLLIEKIGDGGFGEVYKGELKPTNTIVAVKMYIWTPTTAKVTKSATLAVMEAKNQFVQEFNLMRNLRHSNIVHLIGICTSREPMMIVMEYCEKGQLALHLQHYRPILTRKLTYIVDVVRGMEYLEKNNCIHRDLAARNCLLTNKWIVKIADFGLSRQSTCPYVTSKRKFPIKWSAPEAVIYQTFSMKSDVWSFGILMWEVFNDGAVPYPTLNNQQVVEKQSMVPGIRPPVPDSMPKAVADIYSNCTQYDKTNRPTFVILKLQMLEIRSQAREAEERIKKAEKDIPGRVNKESAAEYAQ